jgi:hypothetical protein
VIQGNRALALAYVDARAVQDRLDDCLGVDGWQDSYEVLSDGSVMCKLSIKLGVERSADEWLTKMDVGNAADSSGDKMKAAFSDALKRAAVKFGVARYLYKLPAQWCDFDPAKGQFLKTPSLPPSAIPKKPKPKDQPEEEPKPDLHTEAAPEPAKETAAAAPPASTPAKNPNVPITTAQLTEIADLMLRLGKDYDWLGKQLNSRFQVSEVRQLLSGQAAELIGGLSKMAAKPSN